MSDPVRKSQERCDPDLAELLLSPERASEIPGERVLVLLTQLSALQSTLAARLLAIGPPDGPRKDPEVEERLLTIPQVAEILAIPKGHGYDLARRGVIPTVRFGKYVRVRVIDVYEWVARHRQNGLDNPLYTVYSTHRRTEQHDRRRIATNPKATRAHPGRSGRASRRFTKHRGQVGKGRSARSGTHGAAHPSVGQEQRDTEG